MQKKLTSAVLAAIMTASMVAIPVSAEGINPETAIDSISSVQPRTATWEITEDLVRMRREPSLSGEVIMLLQKGEYVYEGADRNHVVADGYTWVYVHSNRTGWSGWVASEFMDCGDY